MKPQVFAVVDTNVLVAGFLSKHPESPTVRIIQAIIEQDLHLVVHPEILDEYLDVLSRPKLKLNLNKVEEFMEIVHSIGISMTPTQYEEELPDPKDRIFYEVSLTGESYLITGNQKHFPINPRVVSPAEMIQILYCHPKD